MRTSLLLITLCMLGLSVSACQDTGVDPPPDTRIGKVTVAEFRADRGFATWFDHSYAAYPAPAFKASFDAEVSSIRTEIDSSHSVIMVVKPSCTCQRTQQTMPAVLKVLDEAGFPHSNVHIYITDARLVGFDEIKHTHTPAITDAPTFIVMKGGIEKGRISDLPTSGQTVEQVLASFFAAP